MDRRAGRSDQLSTGPWLARLPDLPVRSVLPELQQALGSFNRAVLVAEPGAGKTTLVPLVLATTASSAGRWLVLEPRRVAARLAAARMAELLEESVGQTVGYRVRGEQRISRDTRIEVVTQGILTRMLQDDPFLEGVAGLIFDEFHERSLDADLGLALALDVQQGLREDLRLLVMSATLDLTALGRVLGEGVPVISSVGRSWPIETHDRPPLPREEPAQQQARVIREVLAAHPGNVLVFLPGQGEIRRLQKVLQAQLPQSVEVCELHGQLPLAAQQAVLRPAAKDQRRVILATAIAESSLTVPDVRIVVDAGLERVPVYQARSGLTRLETRRVNRASADQRRGRAGRLAEGWCYRLWAADETLRAHAEPEILQADLAGLVFEIARWGLRDPTQLSWVSLPPAASLARGRALLELLGVLDDDGALSSRGRQCARWPTHPRLAVLLEAAEAARARTAACWLVAWLEEGRGERELDLSTLLERRPRRDGGIHAGWWRGAQQWLRVAGLRGDQADEFNLAAVPGLLARAFPDRIAQSVGPGRFRLASGTLALVPEQHALAHADWLVAVELDGQANGARVFHAVAVDSETLERALPEARTWRERVVWDEPSGRLIGESVRRIGELVLERRPLARLPAESVVQALLVAVRRRGSLAWTPADTQLRGRLRLLRQTVGEIWPDVDDAALLESLETWLAPRLDGVTRLEQLDALPLGAALLDTLDWSQRQRLDQLAPTHLAVPSGSRIRIDYSGDEPVLAVKLQEMFGQVQTPCIVDGRVPLLIHLLSPAGRPVQVTRDLASFWQKTYFDVRKDLKGRYPRHPWPDDPMLALPTRRTVGRRP